MPFQPKPQIESGHAIAQILNSATIIINTIDVVDEVVYYEATDTIQFHLSEGRTIVFSRESFAVADWDEDHTDDSFYVVLDTENIHHTMKFYRAVTVYRNESLEFMRQVKESF